VTGPQWAVTGLERGSARSEPFREWPLGDPRSYDLPDFRTLGDGPCPPILWRSWSGPGTASIAGASRLSTPAICCLCPVRAGAGNCSDHRIPQQVGTQTGSLLAGVNRQPADPQDGYRVGLTSTEASGRFPTLHAAQMARAYYLTSRSSQLSTQVEAVLAAVPTGYELSSPPEAPLKAPGKEEASVAR